MRTSVFSSGEGENRGRESSVLMNNCSASVSFTSRPTGSPPPDTHTSLSFSVRPFFLSLYPHAGFHCTSVRRTRAPELCCLHQYTRLYVCVWARRGAVMHSWSLSVMREAARDSSWKGPTSPHHNSCLFLSDKSENIYTYASGTDPEVHPEALHAQNVTGVCCWCFLKCKMYLDTSSEIWW